MSKGIRFQVVCVLALFAGMSVQATQYWWSGNGTTAGGSGTWNTTAATNWSSSVGGPFDTAWPDSYSDEAIFTNTSGSTVTVSGTNKVGVVTIYTNNITVAGGVLDFGSNPGLIKLADSPPAASRSQATFNNRFKGSGGMTVFSAGSPSGNGYGFKLLGNNSGLTGNLVITTTNGVCDVTVTNDFNFGAVPAVYTPDALTFSNKGYNIDSIAGNTITIATNRGITLAGGAAVSLYQTVPYILNSRITGSGALAVNTTTATFNQQNDFAGNLTLVGSKAIIGVDNAFPYGAGKGILVFSYGGNVDLNGHNLRVNGFSGSNGRTVLFNTSATPVTLTIGDGNNSSTLYGAITNGASDGAISVEKTGTGTTTLQVYTNADGYSYSGATTVSGGILAFDHTITPDQTHSTLTMNGGTLQFTGALATTNVSLTFTDGTVPFNAGGNGLTVTNRGGTATLTLGNTWTRDPDATLIVTLLGGGTSTLSSSPALSSNIVWGGYCFVKDANGIGHATVSGGNVIRNTSGYTFLDSAMATSNLDSTARYYVNASQVLSGSATTQTVDSIALTNAGTAMTLTLSNKVLVVGRGGIIMGVNGNYVDLGNSVGTQKGTVTAPGGSDLVFYLANYSNQGRIWSNIADNNGTVRVVIAGSGAGTYGLQMLGTYTYSGDTIVNGGLYTLNIPYGTGKGNLLLNSGGSVSLTANASVNGLTQSSGNAGGWIGVTTSSGGPYTLKVGNNDASASFSGYIQHSGANLGLTLIKVGNGTQTLAGVANTYKCGTILSNGVLSVCADGCLGAAGSNVTFAGGTLMVTGTNLTSLSSRIVNWDTFNGGLSINDAANTFTVTNVIGGSGGLTKSGAGTLVLSAVNTNSGGTVINGGTLQLACNNAVSSNGSLTVASGASLNLAGYQQTVTGALSLSGTYVVNVYADGSCGKVSTTGALDLTGATLSVVNTNLLDNSKQYVVLSYGTTLTGTFSANNLPDTWVIKYDAAGKQVLLRRSNSGFILKLH